ncbi:hypothetical protein MPLB_1730003 [Mesorhizobium sp. ORS 3324]|nr:hypothetical protein MPLB_1730003 [Mesorhizobium sp. ORS 3324]
MKRLCALAIKERGLGGRTFTRVIRDEDGDAAWAAVRDHVSRSARVIADHPTQPFQSRSITLSPTPAPPT